MLLVPSGLVVGLSSVLLEAIQGENTKARPRPRTPSTSVQCHHIATLLAAALLLGDYSPQLPLLLEVPGLQFSCSHVCDTCSTWFLLSSSPCYAEKRISVYTAVRIEMDAAGVCKGQTKMTLGSEICTSVSNPATRLLWIL